MADESKKCKTCGEVKPDYQFRILRSAKRSHYHDATCIQCRQEKLKKYRREVYSKRICPITGLSQSRVEQLWKDYKLAAKDYKRLFDEQQGKCGICTDLMIEIHVDHSHTTGEVRRLLCPDCNKGLAFFKESSARLLAAIAYLEKHNGQSP